MVACGDAAIIDRGGSDVPTDRGEAVTDATMQDVTIADAVDVPTVDVPTMDVVSADVDDVPVVLDVGDVQENDVTCPAMQRACSGRCVDLQADMNNCGMCGVTCPVGQRCNMGVCSANCGVAGLVCCPDNMCNAGFDCVMGMCQMHVIPPPVRSGAELVSAGARLSSTNFQMQSTLGQSSQHQQRMSSTNFVLTGGLVGVIGGP